MTFTWEVQKHFDAKNSTYKPNFCASSLFAIKMKLNISVFYSGRKSKKNHFFSPFSIEAIRKGFAFRIVPAYKGLFSSRFSSRLCFSKKTKKTYFPHNTFIIGKCQHVGYVLCVSINRCLQENSYGTSSYFLICFVLGD